MKRKIKANTSGSVTELERKKLKFEIFSLMKNPEQLRAFWDTKNGKNCNFFLLKCWNYKLGTASIINYCTLSDDFEALSMKKM